MNQFNERALVQWLAEGPEQAPPDMLARALVATRQTRKRPKWMFPQRWLPVELGLRGGPRSAYVLALVGLLVLTVVASLLLVVASRPRLPDPIGPARNGVITLATGGGVVVTEADGTNRREITRGLGVAYSPTFSPDGTKIAFWTHPVAAPDGSPVELWVSAADGSGGHSVGTARPTEDLPVVDWPPSWSSTGTELVFHSVVRGVSRLLVAQADGSGVEELAGTGGGAWPQWSPTGEWIAYQHGQGFGRRVLELRIVRPDGSERQMLMKRTVEGMNSSFQRPEWSPDGTRLAFWVGDTRAYDIAVVDLAGNVATISAEATNEAHVRWSPDGRWVAFLADSEGLLIARADGSERRRLSHHVLQCGLTWSPDGTMLLGSDCASVVAVPLASNGEPTRIPPSPGGGVAGPPSWQRLAP